MSTILPSLAPRDVPSHSHTHPSPRAKLTSADYSDTMNQSSMTGSTIAHRHGTRRMAGSGVMGRMTHTDGSVTVPNSNSKLTHSPPNSATTNRHANQRSNTRGRNGSMGRTSYPDDEMKESYDDVDDDDDDEPSPTSSALPLSAAPRHTRRHSSNSTNSLASDSHLSSPTRSSRRRSHQGDVDDQRTVVTDGDEDEDDDDETPNHEDDEDDNQSARPSKRIKTDNNAAASQRGRKRNGIHANKTTPANRSDEQVDDDDGEDDEGEDDDDDDDADPEDGSDDDGEVRPASSRSTISSSDPISGVRDPAVLRLYHTFTRPTDFQRHMTRNWNVLRQLMPKAQETAQAKKSLVDESDASRSVVGPSVPPSAVAAVKARRDAAAAAAVAQIKSEPIASITSSNTPTGATASSSSSLPRRDFRHLPTSFARTLLAVSRHRLGRTGRHRRNFDPITIARPASCPPKIINTQVETDVKRILPEWIQEWSQPKVKQEGKMKGDETSVKSEHATSHDGGGHIFDHTDDELSFHHPQRAAWLNEIVAQSLFGTTTTGVGVGVAGRPLFNRSVSAHPSSSVYFAVSAPTTPAVTSAVSRSGIEVAASASTDMNAASVTCGVDIKDAFMHLAAQGITSPPLNSIGMTIVPTSANAITNAATTTTTTTTTSTDANISTSLTTTSTSSSSTSSVPFVLPLPILTPRSVSIAIGSRPTPSSPTYATDMKSPIARAHTRPSSSTSSSVSSTRPQFGDSILLTSIPSSTLPPAQSPAAIVASATGLARTIALRSPHIASTMSMPGVSAPTVTSCVPTPISHPPHGLMSPSMTITRLPSTIASTGVASSGTATGSTSPPLAGLQEWCLLSSAYVESYLRPPTLQSLANGTRQSRQVLAATLEKFTASMGGDVGPKLTGTSMEVDARALSEGILQPVNNSTSTAVTPASSPSAGQSHVGQLIHPPVSPLTQPMRRGSLSVSLNNNNATSTSIITTATTTAAAAGVGGVKTPFSPNLPPRMSSWLQSQPTTPNTPGLAARKLQEQFVQQQQQQAQLMSPTIGPIAVTAQSLPFFSRQPTVNTATTTTTATTSTTTSTSGDVELEASLSPPVSHSGHTESRVGTNYQCIIPPLFTHRQREIERVAYLHAHAAVHGFPRHLPSIPSPSGGGIEREFEIQRSYLPIPRILRPPYVIPSFPASTAMSFTSKRSILRESLMGSRKAARRKTIQSYEDRTTRGRRSGPPTTSATTTTNNNNSTISFDKPPLGFNLAEIWPLSWEEYQQQQQQQQQSHRTSSTRGRKRTRGGDMMVSSAVGDDRKPLYTHPSFTSFASIFPSESPLAKIHFDDDTLSPYFACASFVRPPSPISNVRVRSFSPVHVLSVPSTPANPSLPPSLHRFPSSLLDPASFNRRITSLVKGEEQVEELYGSDDEHWDGKRPKRNSRLDDIMSGEDEEDEPVKSSSNRFGRVIKPTSRSGTTQRRSTTTVASSVTSNNSKPYTGERFKRWKMVDGKRIVWYIDSTGRTVFGQNPEQYAAATRKKIEAADNESSDCGSPDDSQMEDSNSENDDSNDEVVNGSSDDDHPTRFGRRRSRFSTNSHLSSNGRRASSLPPIPPSFSSSSMTHTRSSGNFIPMPMPTPNKTINLSDLSPSVRILSTKSGVAKMIESMAEVFPSDCEDVDLDHRMSRVIARWQEEDANLIMMMDD